MSLRCPIAVTSSGIVRRTPADIDASSCSDSRAKPAMETYRMALPTTLGGQFEMLNANR